MTENSPYSHETTSIEYPDDEVDGGQGSATKREKAMLKSGAYMYGCMQMRVSNILHRAAY